MKSDYLQGILDTLTVPDTRLPTFWAQDNVYIAHSERRLGLYDRNYAPWINEPVDCLADPRVFASSLCGSVQGAKTQALEVFMCWALAIAPGHSIFTGQTDIDAELIIADKILKTLKASPGTKNIVAGVSQDSVTKTRLDLPGMTIDIQGPGGNKIQSKSKKYLINDEFWKYKQGVFAQLLKRSDAVTDRKIFSASQAGEEHKTETGGVVWDDWGWWWHQGTQELFSIQCPACLGRFCPETSDMRWDDNTSTRNPVSKTWKWKALKETVRLKCRHCGTEHHPGYKVEDRQAMVHKLACSGIYVPQNPEAMAGDLIHRSYRWPVWTVWWKDWGDMAEEFLLAVERLRFGIIDDLKLWTQQREAKFWTLKDAEVPSFQDRKFFGFKVGDYKGGVDSDGSARRVMTVDMQTGVWKVLILDVFFGGKVRVVFVEPEAKSWEELGQIAARFRLQPYHVAVDSKNWAQEVWRECGKRGWVALQGSGLKTWAHNLPTKETVSRPFSPVRQGRVAIQTPKKGGGRPGSKPASAYYYDWSNLVIKDWLSRMLSTDMVEYPDDVHKEFIDALDSEARRSGADGKPKWEQIGSRPNHFWDCLCMALVLNLVIDSSGKVAPVFVDPPVSDDAGPD